MVPIGGEAFVYILIICIRLNRNYHLKLTNGEQGSLERESGMQQQQWDRGQTLFNQILGFPEFARMKTQLPAFPGSLGCAFGEYELAGAYEGHLFPPVSGEASL